MARTKTRTRVLFALVAALALVGTSCSASTDSADGGDEVVLQGVDTVEVDPFTDSVALTEFASFPSRTADAIEAALAAFEAAADAMRTIPGDTPGLYGGTGDDATCDMAQLNDYLADAANADKATAFAQTLGIRAGEIDDTLDGFTTVVLSVDTLVTNHGYTDGAANAFAAVLQAGTAIAVDDHGIPRVKCGCGNPLAPAPTGLVLNDDTPTTGGTWPGWDPARVARPVPSTGPVDGFDVIDPETGEMHRIPTGAPGDGSDEGCVVDADGHGPDCDPGDEPAPDTTTPSTDTPVTTAAPPRTDPPPGTDGDPTGDPDDRSWEVTGGAASPDEDFRVRCAPNGRFHPVAGSGPYEVSSSVCTAAVHAGVITREQGGMVTIRMVDTGGPMDGSTANGVTTEPTGNPRGFFDFF